VVWLQSRVCVGSDGEHQCVLDPAVRAAGSQRDRGGAVNARHLRGVPGARPTCSTASAADAAQLRIAQGSFRPDESICQLRALQRERANLVAERTRIVQRMQKALDQMNVQVHHAVTT